MSGPAVRQSRRMVRRCVRPDSPQRAPRIAAALISAARVLDAHGWQAVYPDGTRAGEVWAWLSGALATCGKHPEVDVLSDDPRTHAYAAAALAGRSVPHE